MLHSPALQGLLFIIFNRAITPYKNLSMKLKELFLIFLLTLSTAGLYSQNTQVVYLSGRDAANTVEWDFYCTDGQNSGRWTKIPVPSNWELQGFGTYNYGHDWADKEIKLGREHGLYKYQFNVPPDWKGKTVNLSLIHI